MTQGRTTRNSPTLLCKTINRAWGVFRVMERYEILAISRAAGDKLGYSRRIGRTISY